MLKELVEQIAGYDGLSQKLRQQLALLAVATSNFEFPALKGTDYFGKRPHLFDSELEILARFLNENAIDQHVLNLKLNWLINDLLKKQPRNSTYKTSMIVGNWVVKLADLSPVINDPKKDASEAKKNAEPVQIAYRVERISISSPDDEFSIEMASLNTSNLHTFPRNGEIRGVWLPQINREAMLFHFFRDLLYSTPSVK